MRFHCLVKILTLLSEMSSLQTGVRSSLRHKTQRHRFSKDFFLPREIHIHSPKLTYCWWKKSGKPVEVGSWKPIIYSVLYIPRWLFGISEPSTVAPENGSVGILSRFLLGLLVSGEWWIKLNSAKSVSCQENLPTCLVGAFNPFEKILYGQIGTFPQVGENRKKYWNHHPLYNTNLSSFIWKASPWTEFTCQPADQGPHFQ